VELADFDRTTVDAVDERVRRLDGARVDGEDSAHCDVTCVHSRATVSVVHAASWRPVCSYRTPPMRNPTTATTSPVVVVQ
jgi:hypothetical protein